MPLCHCGFRYRRVPFRDAQSFCGYSSCLDKKRSELDELGTLELFPPRPLSKGPSKAALLPVLLCGCKHCDLYYSLGAGTTIQSWASNLDDDNCEMWDLDASTFQAVLWEQREITETSRKCGGKVHVNHNGHGQAFSSVFGVRGDITGNLHIVRRRDKGVDVVEWGDDVKAVSEDEAMVLVNHQATGDVCTLMMCLQDKGTVVRQMMWLMDHIFKYTNFGIVSLIHGDFFIRQGRTHRDQQLVLLKDHLEKYYRSRNRKWIVLFPEGGFLRKRRETSQAFAKKNNLPFLKHVTLPRLGATQVILKTLVAPQENGAPSGGDAVRKESKSKGLQWVIDTTIAYPKAEPIDIQTWILGYRQPTVTHVHYRLVPLDAHTPLLGCVTVTVCGSPDVRGSLRAFPPPQGQTKAISREMTLSNLWLVAIQSFAFLSGGMWYCLFQYLYHCLF
ncbi:hypothetical protein DV515_00004042 [Chloebia gouldiae]|uniref:Phospholipid/glycerol acyltransferase domain-containing protein n=1 Tax=Chloebia gouldiae TaxID=44316 RepID=A0A3L8SRU8_CHLGU|nr:hypothetical protein DV515_00004042 [Chloebia gouldiae]